MQFFKSAVCSFLISSIIVSCGQSNVGGRNQGSDNSGPAPQVVNSTSAPATSTQPAQNSKVTGMLLGRAPAAQQNSAKPTFVEIPVGTKIASGAHAAQLFATGRPVDVTRAQSGQSQTMSLDGGYGYGSSYSTDYSYWNWILGGLLVLGGAAMMYYQPIGSYSYEGYSYYPYQPAPAQPVPYGQPVPY